jgi:hypothetical protein
MMAAHDYAKKGMDNSEVGVLWLKEHSGNGQDLDIKTKLGEEQGYLFQGSYISGESAGNYLFGKNLALVDLIGVESLISCLPFRFSAFSER